MLAADSCVFGRFGRISPGNNLLAECIDVNRHYSAIEKHAHKCVLDIVMIARNIFKFMNEVVKPVNAVF